MCPRYILSDNNTELKNHLMDQVLQQLSIDCILFTPYHPQSNRKLEVFHKYLKPPLKKLCEKDPTNWDKYINQVLTSYRVTPNLATAETPFFGLWQRSKPTITPTSRANTMIPRQSRICLTQPGSPSSSSSHFKGNTR